MPSKLLPPQHLADRDLSDWPFLCQRGGRLCRGAPSPVSLVNLITGIIPTKGQVIKKSNPALIHDLIDQAVEGR